MIVEVATLVLVGLTKLDGRITYVNPDQVVQLIETREAIGGDNKLFTNEVFCLITLSDKNYVTVRETCDQIRELFTGVHKEAPK